MKKVMSKKLLVLCFTATAICMTPLMASAMERLVIKDDAENITFKVCDTGVAVGTQFSMGTLTPQAPFHINLPSTTGVLHNVGTTLYPDSTGAVMTSQNNSIIYDLTVAEDQGIGGHRGQIRGVRAGGTLESPIAPAEHDSIMSIAGGIWDGNDVRNAAIVTFNVDGLVSPGVVPARITFATRNGGTGPLLSRLTVKNDGKIGIGEANPTSQLHVSGLPEYANNAEATTAGLTPGAFYRTSTGVLMVAF